MEAKRQTLGSTLRFLRALIGTNLRAAFALRGSFWLSVLFMIANNLIMFSIWLIYFDRFDDVGGWHLKDMAVLNGTVSFAWGLQVVLADGTLVSDDPVADAELTVNAVTWTYLHLRLAHRWPARRAADRTIAMATAHLAPGF